MRYADRLRIYRENQKIAASGCYDADGQQIRLPKTAAELAQDTVCLEPDARKPEPAERKQVFRLSA